MVWTSAAIDMSSASSVKVHVGVRSEGTLDSEISTEDYIRLYLKVDGKEKLVDELAGEILNENGRLHATGVTGENS